jgi:predicted RNase H-like HicB family nuclease
MISPQAAIDKGICFSYKKFIRWKEAKMKTSGYIAVTLKFVKEGKRWTAYCVELGTATFGRSIQEANERIREAVLLHLNTLEDVGECERFLKEHGVKFYQQRPKRREIKISPPYDSAAYFKSLISPIHKESYV